MNKIVIKGGLVFDGTINRPRKANILVIDNIIKQISNEDILIDDCLLFDATNMWVTPGFIDLHTHYDAELEINPSIDESIRHGVTTVVMGNCSLSTALGKDKDIVDLFSRVENIDPLILSQMLLNKISWNNVKEYYQHLDSLSLGPNIASFLGHSNIRMEAMGIERSFNVKTADKKEIDKMLGLTTEALESGYIGVSIDMLPFHRWAGYFNKKFLGVSVPSQQASYSEYFKIANVLRKHDRVLQCTPNAIDKKSVLAIMAMSSGILRKSLKTTVVAALDFKSNENLYKVLNLSAFVSNKFLGGNLKFQTLAEPFTVYGDGIFNPLLEELQSVLSVMNIDERDKRKEILNDVDFRKSFYKEWKVKSASPFPKYLDEIYVVGSPDNTMVGKSFMQIAKENNAVAEEYFLDLIAKYDTDLRWKCETANHREKIRVEFLANKNMLPGFNDSGAHNRNMAFHDGCLQTLGLSLKYKDIFPPEVAISKLTKQVADFINVDAGYLAVGKRADIVILDPKKIETDINHNPIEQYPEMFKGQMRLVKRSGKVIKNVFINGVEVYNNQNEEYFSPMLGKVKIGSLLRANN